jgi:hypothetical protein
MKKLIRRNIVRWDRKLVNHLLNESSVPQNIIRLVAGLINESLSPKLKHVRVQEELLEKQSDHEYFEAHAHVGPSSFSTTSLDTSEGGSSTSKPYNKYEPKEICTDDDAGNGFAGTALKLFPNVRETKIELGGESPWFKIFGIDKRVGTVITMFKGPNNRLNRYLTNQYIRLVKSIRGELVSTKVYSEKLGKHYIVKSIKWGSKLRNISRLAKSTHPIKKA